MEAGLDKFGGRSVILLAIWIALAGYVGWDMLQTGATAQSWFLLTAALCGAALNIYRIALAYRAGGDE